VVSRKSPLKLGRCRADTKLAAVSRDLEEEGASNS
jgi:hypothetical protein